MPLTPVLGGRILRMAGARWLASPAPGSVRDLASKEQGGENDGAGHLIFSSALHTRADGLWRPQVCLYQTHTTQMHRDITVLHIQTKE